MRPRFHDPRLESEYRAGGPERGCVAVIAWVAVARLVYIPTAFFLDADGVQDERRILLNAAISAAVSALLVTVPLRLYFGRKKERHVLARSARAYRNRQKE
ncbi:hypothetical protein [Streptomyces phytophilus]|uniref:hypothetical protein n=1 Tax=Streptomyces phytophilus TaxID=722715 RepID=UPI001C68D07E|nr:hypothetical protein [Streptomyces phytophilus]